MPQLVIVGGIIKVAGIVQRNYSQSNSAVSEAESDENGNQNDRPMPRKWPIVDVFIFFARSLEAGVEHPPSAVESNMRPAPPL